MEAQERKWFLDNATSVMKKLDGRAIGKAADALVHDAIHSAMRRALSDNELLLNLKQLGVCDLNVVATIAFSIERALMTKYLADDATRDEELHRMAMALAAAQSVDGIGLVAKETMRVGFAELLATELSVGLRESAIKFALDSEQAVVEIMGGDKVYDA